MASRAKGVSAGVEAPMSVSQLAARIDAALRTGLPGAVRVVGEVSGFRERTHWYFDLKDHGAVVNAVVFQSAARRAGFTPENGRELVATGRVEFYAPGGKVSFIVDRLEPIGAGAMDLAFRKLAEELRALGWFAPERKRAVPTFPRRVAVVTSRSAAALQDVLVTMKSRCSAVGVLLADVRVQGEAAAGEVAAAVRELSDRHIELGIDAILVTRGGGSAEDLWAFNDRELARAIVESAIPVVAAIGHETDTTIAELVADVRCATPTQAAMVLTPDRAALERQADSLAARLRAAAQRSIAVEGQRLASLERHPAMRDPGRGVAVARDRASDIDDRLSRAMSSRLERAARVLERGAAALTHVGPEAALTRARDRVAYLGGRLERGAIGGASRAKERIDALAHRLRAVGPFSVLERGYSMTLTRAGTALRSVDEVRDGDGLTTILADGRVSSVVVKGEARPLRASRRSKGEKVDPGQGSLFVGEGIEAPRHQGIE